MLGHVGHLVAAPDKFRGTATAREVAAAAVRGAARASWTAEAVPMSDGGEGLLDAVGGAARRSTVIGPHGEPVSAEWRLLDNAGVPGTRRTAVIEMAQAAGLTLAGGPEGNDPLHATTEGVGQLIVHAVEAGATQVVVGCGGSATTDGGRGAVHALAGLRARGGLDGVELIVACDVTTPFAEAAATFAPQKGATPAQVSTLAGRLRRLAARYREEFGVDVTTLDGAGAAGGLAGGLAALGARLVPGFELVAGLVGLPSRLASADAVMTGEGHLDRTSLAGKVVGGIIALAPAGIPLICVVGDAEAGVVKRAADTCPGLRIVRLVERVGRAAAYAAPCEAVAAVVAEELARLE